jgi:hypothetical protein
MGNSNKDLPHGHGLSFKKGISDALLNTKQFTSSIPNGHNASYRKGYQEGINLKENINTRVK